MFTKVQIGADCEFERISANTIKTVSTLWPAGTLLVGQIQSRSQARPAANCWWTAVKASGIAVDNSGTFEFLAAAGMRPSTCGTRTSRSAILRERINSR